MKLKQVKLSGFKSFCDETEFQFREHGITTIVGPNGCGKSNVVDAIRWALGEQSPRLMRGSAMGDVIFGGSVSRKPVGRAEVTLLFDNTDRSALEKYNDFSEISVTRRLYRSGESEYLINKLGCRLLDVRELVMDTGAAGRSYSIVEQGRVEEFVTASPLERRSFMEEAAGIVRYKTKRIAAEKKLEQTRQNLLRVEDVLGELKRQETVLRDQMETAQAYLALQEEVALITGDMTRLRYNRSAQRCRELEQGLETLRGEETAIQQALMRLGMELEEGGLEHARLEGQLREAREAVYRRERQIQQDETQLALERQNHANAQAWSEQLAHALDELGHRRVALAGQLDEHRAEIGTLGQRAEALRAEIERDEGAFGAHKAEGDALAAGVRTAQERLLECHTQLNGIENQLQLLAERVQEGERRRTGLEQQSAGLNAELERLQAEQASLQARAAQLRSEREAAEEAIAATEARIAEEEAALARHQEREAALQREVLGWRSRRETLAEIEAGYQGFGDAVRTFLAWADEHPEEREALGLLGPLADLISVPAEAVAWAGDYLAPYLEVLVLRGSETLPRLAERLAMLELGGVRAVALDSLGPASQPPADEQYGERLADVIVCNEQAVRSLAVALFGATRLLPAGTPPHPLPRPLVPGGEWLSRDGALHVDHKAQVTLGKSAAPAAGVLQRRVEIAQLEERLATGEQALAEASAEAARRSALLADLREALRSQEEARAENALAAREVEQALAHGAREAERLEQVRTGIAREAERTVGELEGYGRQRGELDGETTRWRESRTGLEAELAQAREAEEAARGELAAMSEALTERKVEQSRTLSRLDLLNNRLGDLEREGEEVAAKLPESQAELDGQQAKLQAAGAAIERLASALHDAQQALGNQRAEVRARREAFEAQEQRQHGLEDKLKAERRRHELNQSRRHEVELALTAEKMRLEQSEAQLAELPTRPEDIELPDEKTLEHRLTAAQARLRRMEGVNLAAPQEYEALNTRLAFLASQQEDLVKAIEDLEASIRRMNTESRRRFRDTFEQVNEKFQALFPQVFGGGEARLVMTDSEDPLLAGVDIVAQPPGKKLQGLGLLSGGEKALTAISLIFSFFLHKPSPFCLLDEVDAPLDDVNVTRFNRLIISMTEHSQFIIITHNKRTMEVGDTLYGITMEEAGVSKIVSVNLAGPS